MDRKDLLKNITSSHFHKLSEWFKRGETLLVEELWEGAKAFLASLAFQESGKHLLILSTQSHWFGDLPLFLKRPILEFPSWDTLPSENRPPSADVTGERFKVLKTIKESSQKFVIVAPFQAVLEKVVSPETLERHHLQLRLGDELPFGELPSLFTSLSYQRRTVAVDKGEFALRGGIIDIFPLSVTEPYRIEFDGDKIVSIRHYDPLSQLSQKKCDEAIISPAEEFGFLEKKSSSLFDYLGPDTIVLFDDLLAIEDRVVLYGQAKNFHSVDTFFKEINSLQKIYFSGSSLEELSEITIEEKEKFNPYAEEAPPQKIGFSFLNQTLQARRWRHTFFPLYPTFCPREIPVENFGPEDFLKTLLSFPITVNFLASTPSEAQNLRERVCSIDDIKATYEISEGYLTSGFFLKEPGFALVPMCELTHNYKVHRTKQRTHYHAMAHEIFSLDPGEFVVHMQSGVGKYLGVEKRLNHVGVETEFLLLEYAEGAKLYVPMEQAAQLTKYIGVTEESPDLHTLGSGRWKAMREKTERAIVDYAHDLLELQAERLLREGFAYPPHSEITEQFGREFPYEETPDQKEAIAKVYGDMMTKRPMDRLICGDVGYGKTEVAMRAAFKAVVDGGKQVAVLVPTTVLAMQHYETFTARMQNFSLNIGILSRFNTAKETKETLAGVAAGSVDIVIGTHRIVSDDVAFKDLGLVIIDEEQRFGVKVKEHLKKLKKEVDCLTLSATPIPRTLYLSLVGSREMSLINTPPEDRLPIQSMVAESSDELIKSALLRELSRDGQAYVVHNRVETIFGMADKIRTLLPGARVIVGHGQMQSAELDMVFHTFKNGKADILVATSIIENGIDIPKANTILIDRADRMGMADLYQMRGRVGRWNRRAYCYFLVPNLRDLNSVARKRLSALAESSGYGAGMKIAMHDLEIRGAGNILGLEQSGHITNIGFHLYCKLLKKTLNALKKKKSLSFAGNLKIEFPYDARLPEDYVNEMSLRMEIYQRLGDADEESEIEELRAEMIDRFGPIPEPTEWLLAITKIRIFAEPLQFTHLRLKRGLLSVTQMVGKKSIEKSGGFALPKTPQDLVEKVVAALTALSL